MDDTPSQNIQQIRINLSTDKFTKQRLAYFTKDAQYKHISHPFHYSKQIHHAICDVTSMRARRTSSDVQI